MLLACSSADQPGSDATMRDSAGVRIVENRSPAGGNWTVSTEPIFGIGAVDGPPEYTLSRVIGAARLGDMRIAVADGGSSSVRYYDAGGSWLGSSGRQGQGPGEYVDIGALSSLPGDSMMVADNLMQRVTVLDSTGQYARSTPLESVDGRYSIGLYITLGMLDDGRILAYSGSGRGFREDDAGRLIVDTLHFFLFDRDGAFVRRVAAMPGSPRWGLRSGGSVTFPNVPFAAGPVSGIGRGRLVVSEGGDAEFMVFRDGDLERIVRWPAPRRATSSTIADLRETLLGDDRTAAQRNASRQLLDEAPLPDSLPTVRSIVVDRDSNTWVERYRAPRDTQPEWDVFDSEGRWIQTLQTPLRLRIHEIGADYILGTWRDDLGVEFVRMYSLQRGGG